jgi:polysaccharide pyruvyl transferase WcaK-like protein
VLAIAYYRKTVDLMEQIGQSDYVVDITSFDATSLAERFVTMESSMHTIRREIAQRALGLQQVVAKECDRVFGLLEDPSGIRARAERAPALAS